MKRKNYLLFLLPLILLFTGIIAQSCSDKYNGCTQKDYDACKTSRPVVGEVEVLVTINSENPVAIVRMFRGKIEDDDLMWEKLYRNRDETEIIEIDTYYSFTVTYQRGNETITAIDGGEIDVRSFRMCDRRCYETRPLTIDLRLMD